MTWDRTESERVARAYRRHYECVTGDEIARQQVDEFVWAVDVVHHRALEGTLPLEFVDAAIHDPDATDAYLTFVANDVLEDLLTAQERAVVDGIATRCGADERWAALVAKAWLQPREWDRLPAALQQRVLRLT